MGLFAYIALDASGRQMTGTVPADTRAEAMDNVIRRGLSPISVSEEKSAAARAQKASTSTKVPQSAVESFTRELANLLAAGLPLSRALHLLRREASHPGAKNVWTAIHDDVIHTPRRPLIEEPIIEGDLRFASQDFGPDLRIFFFSPLVDVLHAVTRVRFDFVGIGIHKQRLKQ